MDIRTRVIFLIQLVTFFNSHSLIGWFGTHWERERERGWCYSDGWICMLDHCSLWTGHRAVQNSKTEMSFYRIRRVRSSCTACQLRLLFSSSNLPSLEVLFPIGMCDLTHENYLFILIINKMINLVQHKWWRNKMERE